MGERIQQTLEVRRKKQAWSPIDEQPWRLKPVRLGERVSVRCRSHTSSIQSVVWSGGGCERSSLNICPQGEVALSRIVTCCTFTTRAKRLSICWRSWISCRLVYLLAPGESLVGSHVKYQRFVCTQKLLIGFVRLHASWNSPPWFRNLPFVLALQQIMHIVFNFRAVTISYSLRFNEELEICGEAIPNRTPS